MKIEIYSKPACPFCDKALFLAQQVVQESSHTYNKYMLNEDFTREECGADFTIEHEMGLQYIPHYCTFCGSEIYREEENIDYDKEDTDLIH